MRCAYHRFIHLIGLVKYIRDFFLSWTMVPTPPPLSNRMYATETNACKGRKRRTKVAGTENEYRAEEI